MHSTTHPHIHTFYPFNPFFQSIYSAAGVAVHFVDIGLMNATIAWFPLRCMASIAAHLCGRRLALAADASALTSGGTATAG